MAAKRLSELDEWKRARVVKCNPDPPQIPVRLRALYDGKLLFAPVPYLTKGFPYLRIDPDKLAAKGVDFETAATAQGFMEHGEPVGFEDMPKLDFCVVGCVAVTRRGGRTGKGAGFADLEHGIFRELGLVDDATPIATTVHSSQVVDEAEVVMERHDTALEFHRDRARADRHADALSASRRRRLGQGAPRPVRRHSVPRRTARVDRSAEADAMIVDDPEAKAEVEGAFAAYERALVDQRRRRARRVLLASEHADPLRRRRKPLRLSRRSGRSAPRARRRASRAGWRGRRIVTYGRDLAIAATLFRRDGAPGKIGRQMQTWVRFPEGWRIVAAHVSVIDEPAS